MVAGRFLYCLSDEFFEQCLAPFDADQRIGFQDNVSGRMDFEQCHEFGSLFLIREKVDAAAVVGDMDYLGTGLSVGFK